MRARNIKPSFFKNEDLVKIPESVRLLFIGLWCLADRKGRLEDRPARIKMEIYPSDPHDIDTMLAQLQNHAFIERYTVDKKHYIQIINFEKHQYPHVKEQASTIPAPGKHHASTMLARLNPSSLNPESPILNPDKVVAQAPKRILFSKPTPQQVTEYAKSIGFELDGEHFVNHYEARGWKYGPGRPVESWKAAVVTWKKKQGEFGNNGRPIATPAPRLPPPPPPEKELSEEDRLAALNAIEKFKKGNQRRVVV